HMGQHAQAKMDDGSIRRLPAHENAPSRAYNKRIIPQEGTIVEINRRQTSSRQAAVSFRRSPKKVTPEAIALKSILLYNDPSEPA
ncbi:MAG: hypothetical protein ACI4MP_07745, partial [Candidatus Ventricola sp.]